MLATSPIESLHTYAEGYGSTERLATACAALLDPGGPMRHVEFDEVYSKRSKIMHGRATGDTPGERLKVQACCHQLLRTRLCRVLPDANGRCAECGRRERKAYFTVLRAGVLTPVGAP